MDCFVWGADRIPEANSFVTVMLGRPPLSCCPSLRYDYKMSPAPEKVT